MIDTWKDLLEQEQGEPYMQQLNTIINRDSNILVPRARDIYAAFRLTPITSTRVVIVGQDPYPREGDATGLAFSCNKPNYVPESLKAIFRELMVSTGRARYRADLSDWARQGVLLLNRILTAQVGKTKSHEGLGWEVFTDKVIKHLGETKEGLVFVLWGVFAQEVIPLIPLDKGHLILTAAHPAAEAHKPGSGFYKCNHFNLINNHLLARQSPGIKWG